MSEMRLGIGLALVTAALWALSPMLIASAGRRIGSFPVALLRFAISSLLFAAITPVYAALSHGAVRCPTRDQILWLVASGLTGMAAGDVLLYEAFVTLGPRRSTQVLTLAPLLPVLVGWTVLGEPLSSRALAGVLLVIGGTSYAVTVRTKVSRRRADEAADSGVRGREPGVFSARGLAFAGSGAACVGLEAIAGRQAFRVAGPALDPVVATAVRVITSAVCVWGIALACGRLARVWRHLADRFIVGRVLSATSVGTIIGMLCYITALKHAPAGIVSSLVSTSPLFILPMVAIRYRAPLPAGAVIAAIIAVAGMALVLL